MRGAHSEGQLIGTDRCFVNLCCRQSQIINLSEAMLPSSHDLLTSHMAEASHLPWPSQTIINILRPLTLPVEKPNIWERRRKTENFNGKESYSDIGMLL